MDCLDPSIAKHLELHCEITTLEEACEAASRFQDVEDAYLPNAGTMSRQRAVWDNDRRQMTADLSKGGGKGKLSTCKTCNGIGHTETTCPTTAAAKDSAFQAKHANNHKGLFQNKIQTSPTAPAARKEGDTAVEKNRATGQGDKGHPKPPAYTAAQLEEMKKQDCKRWLYGHVVMWFASSLPEFGSLSFMLLLVSIRWKPPSVPRSA